MNNPEPLITISKASFRYFESPERALSDISLQVFAGTSYIIAGHTGAGKTTLCRTMNGIIPNLVKGNFEGEVLVEGNPTIDVAPSSLAKTIGLVFQDYTAQLFSGTVELELAFPLENLGVSRHEMTTVVEDTLESLDIAGLRHRAPHSLSGGQQQKVALASVLSLKPKALVLDEAMTDLDPEARDDLRGILRRLRGEDGCAVVLVEPRAHDSSESDLVFLMSEGGLIGVGSPTDVLSDFEMCRTAGVSPDPIAEILFAAGQQTDYGRPEVAAEWLRGVRFDAPRQAAPTPGDVLIQIGDLHYEYAGGIKALRGVDLEIRKGEMVALVGRNGSGKSTLAMLMAGLYRPTEGRILVRGRRPHSVAPIDLAKTVGLVFQDPDHQIFTEKVTDEVEFGLRNAGMPELERKTVVAEALKAVGISDYRHDDPFSLPRGIRQLTTIAAALAMDPDILVLDEPITGLDSREIDRLIGLLKTLNRNGKTIIIITHSMELAARCSGRMIVMSEGEVALDSPTREAFGTERALFNLGLRVPKVAKLGSMLGGAFVTREEALGSLRRTQE